MKITIQTKETNREIEIPNALIFNPATVWMLQSVLKKNLPAGLSRLDGRSRRAVLTQFNKIRKRHGTWTLVEVESKNGDQVTVTI